MVLCCAKIVDSAEEPALILEELLPLSEALGRFSGGVEISLNSEHQAILPQLREVIERHKGPQPLFLQTTGADGFSRRVRAGRELGVTISEGLAEELAELVGSDRVGLVTL